MDEIFTMDSPAAAFQQGTEGANHGEWPAQIERNGPVEDIVRQPLEIIGGHGGRGAPAIDQRIEPPVLLVHGRRGLRDRSRIVDRDAHGEMPAALQASDHLFGLRAAAVVADHDAEPMAARRAAVALPMPLLPPVTSATFGIDSMGISIPVIYGGLTS